MPHKVAQLTTGFLPSSDWWQPVGRMWDGLVDAKRWNEVEEVVTERLNAGFLDQIMVMRIIC